MANVQKVPNISIILTITAIIVISTVNIQCQDYNSIVHGEFKSCCKDEMPTGLGDLRSLHCYFTAAFKQQENYILFTGNNYFQMKLDGKMFHPVSNSFTPLNGARISVGKDHEVYAVFETDSRYYFQILRLPQILVSEYSKSPFKKKSTSCVWRCAQGVDLPKFTDFPALSESKSKMIIGSIEFKTETSSLTIVPGTTVEDPFDFKVETIRRYKDKQQTTDTSGKDFTGSFHTFAAIVIETKANIHYYWTFHRYNWACFMSRSVDDQSVVFDFPEPSLNEILPQCYRTQVFFGCPQSFCYNHEVDDFMVKPSGGTKTVVLLRGLYLWDLPAATELPLQLPKVQIAKRIGNNNLPWSGLPKTQYIDAAEAFTVDKNLVMLIIKEKALYLSVNGTHSVSQISDVFTEQSEATRIHSAWYNTKDKQLFLFSDNKFQSYNLEIDSGKVVATLDGAIARGIYDEFQGMPSKIDAVLSNMNDKVYFMSSSWYYTVKASDWTMNKQYTPQNTFDPSNRFFETQGDPCKIDQSTYDTQYKPKLEEYMRPSPSTKLDFIKSMSVEIVEGAQQFEDIIKAVSGSGGGGGTAIIIIVVVLLLIVIIGAAAVVAFIFYKKSSEETTSKQQTPINAKSGKQQTKSTMSRRSNRSISVRSYSKQMPK